MRSTWSKGATTLASLSLLLALGACGDRVENTEMPMAAQASVETNRQGMEGAKDSDAANGVANHTAAMGAAPRAVEPAKVEDPDDRIAADVRDRLASDPLFGQTTKVDVHSDDGIVTLRGRAPDPAAKDRASELARNVPAVKSVDNQLTLG